MRTTRRSPAAASGPGPEITAGSDEIDTDCTGPVRRPEDVAADPWAADRLARWRQVDGALDAELLDAVTLICRVFPRSNLQVLDDEVAR